MKEETATEHDARRRLEFFEQQVVDAHKTVSECQQLLEKERKTYATSRPLTEAERAELAAHVAAGGALCCEKGLEWLLERLPKPWADAVNGWAYEHLGCGLPKESERCDRYAAEVRNLKLNELPNGRED